MTKRSDGEWAERVITGIVIQSGEMRDARAERFAGKRVERPSGRNSPTWRRRRTAKEDGEERGAKGIPQSALWGSVNATLKSAYKSLRRRFPSARGVPIGLKLVRLTASRAVSLPRALYRRLFVPSARTLTRLGNEGKFFCNRCVSATLQIDSIVTNIVSAIVMILEVLSQTYIEMFVDKRTLLDSEIRY